MRNWEELGEALLLKVPAEQRIDSESPYLEEDRPAGEQQTETARTVGEFL